MSGDHWTSMFEPGRGGRGTTPPPPPIQPPLTVDRLSDDEVAIDPTDYRPWVIQRGRSRPAMMLHLRRFEERSGLWMGWALSYPHLAAIEYVGDRMVSLDFGVRHFVIQGDGLGELIGPLQQGAVISLYEYAPTVWSHRPAGPVVLSILRAGLGDVRSQSNA